MMNDEDAPIVSEHMLDERKMKEKRRARTFVEVRFQVRTHFIFFLTFLLDRFIIAMCFLVGKIDS